MRYAEYRVVYQPKPHQRLPRWMQLMWAWC